MAITMILKGRRVFSRIALSGLLLLTMAAALHISGVTAQAADATLSWSAPTTLTDGSPITDLTGYNVHVGSASRQYDQKLDVGKATSYMVPNLTAGGTYYFAVTAYNSFGAESPFSNEVSKTFAALPTTYVITATAGSGGTITAIGNSSINVASSGSTTITSVTVNDGANQSFSIAAASGYGITDVRVDGTSVGSVTSYTFSTVKGAHTLSASFAPKTSSYTITASAGAGGTITPSGTATLAAGSNTSYSIAAGTGYKVSAVTVDGVSVGAVSSYSFSNLAANHSIAASFAASSTGTTTSTTFAANSGGAQYTTSQGTTYAADSRYSGGNVGTTTATISGTTDGALYKSERYGNFSYNIPIANGSYSLTLKFAEIYFTAPGQRVFSVAVNGQTVVSDLDIFAKVGKNKAYDVVIPVNVTNGAISISFISKVNNAKVSAMRLAPAAATSPVSGSVVFADNAGGALYAGSTGITYAADSKYTGGSVGTTTAAISNTTDDRVYQSERYGNFSYNLPVANGNYQVTLKFAENYWTATGKRVFSVKINGQTAVSNLDLYAKAGKNVAYDVVIPVTVTNGTLGINFISQTNYAKVNGIVVKSM